MYFFPRRDTFVVLYLILMLTKHQTAQDVFGVFNNISVAYGAMGSRTGRILLNGNFAPSYDSENNILTGQQFDFIIIGSGSAGSVLANRLSENPKWNVLLLEAGKEPSTVVEIPALASLFQFTDYNWGYLMEKQDNMCLGLKDQRMAWPRGKALGGTTIINYMIHIRGNRVDFDRWAEAGNKGWSYDEILPYFKKSEDFLVKLQDEGYHQRGGYVGVQDIPIRSASSHVFLRAMQEYGYPIVDYNGKEQRGASYVHGTLRNGRRSSALSAFLDTSRHRPNLKILTRARVTKILIDPLTKQAHGVEFARGQKYFVAKATKEVILSAGTLNSPQVLMLSGVGPKSHLDELKIPVVQNLPVGQKLYDHLTFLGLAFTVNESIVLQQSSLTTPDAILKFILSGTGPLTTLGGVEALAILRTPLSKDPIPEYPDVELLFIGGGMQTDRGDFYRKSFRISDHVYNTIWKPLETKYAFSVLPMLYHPRSFGFVELKSKNPFHWPKFHGNFFTDPENFDVKTFIASIREVQKIVKTPAFQRYDARQVTTPVPGCESYPFDSDEYWECALRHVTATLHHQVATCKMGPSADPEAVVDDRLKVHGIKSLRVVDTSVIPKPISAHTNVPAYMIGEKAADMIKEDWMNNLI